MPSPTSDLFHHIQSSWLSQSKHLNIQNWQKKIKALCRDTSDQSPNSVIQLLSSIGDESLCILLSDLGGQLYFRRDWSFGSQHWHKQFYEYLSQRETCWTPLLRRGAFDYLLINHHSTTHIGDLSPFEQTRFKHFLGSECLLPQNVYTIKGDPYAYFFDERLNHKVHIQSDVLIRQLPLYQIFNTQASAQTHALELLKLDLWQSLQFCNRLSIEEGLTPAFTLDEWTPPCAYTHNQCLKHIQYHPNHSGYRLLTEAQWLAAHYNNIYTYTKLREDYGLISSLSKEREWVLDPFSYLPAQSSSPVANKHTYFSCLRDIETPTQRHPVLPSQVHLFRTCRPLS